jgi:hypothetical protein
MNKKGVHMLIWKILLTIAVLFPIFGSIFMGYKASKYPYEYDVLEIGVGTFVLLTILEFIIWIIISIICYIWSK